MLRATAALLVVVGSLTVSNAVSPAARAEPSGVESLVDLAYDAPPGCPDRAQFEARLYARVKHARVPRPLLSAQLTLRGQGVGGRVVLDTRDGTRTEREIHAASCAEAADALALIGALLLEPMPTHEASAEAPADRPAPSPPAAPGSGSEAAQPGRDPSGSAAATADGPAQTVAPPAADARAAARTSASRAELSAPESPAASPSSSSLRFEIFAAALALSGVAPQVRPGFGAGATLAGRPGRRAELSVQAGVRLVPRHTQRSAEGDVDFAWRSGQVALCAGLHAATGGLSLWGCAGAEAGVLRARGRNTENPGSAHPSWIALGPAAVLVWRALPPLFLQAGAEALAPLSRDSFVLAGDTLHRVPPLTFRATLGLGVQAW